MRRWLQNLSPHLGLKGPELLPSCPTDDRASRQLAKCLVGSLRNGRGKIMSKHVMAEGEESELQLASGHPVTRPGISWGWGRGGDLQTLKG